MTLEALFRAPSLRCIAIAHDAVEAGSITSACACPQTALYSCSFGFASISLATNECFLFLNLLNNQNFSALLIQFMLPLYIPSIIKHVKCESISKSQFLFWNKCLNLLQKEKQKISNCRTQNMATLYKWRVYIQLYVQPLIVDFGRLNS